MCVENNFKIEYIRMRDNSTTTIRKLSLTRISYAMYLNIHIWFVFNFSIVSIASSNLLKYYQTRHSDASEDIPKIKTWIFEG